MFFFGCKRLEICFWFLSQGFKSYKTEITTSKDHPKLIEIELL